MNAQLTVLTGAPHDPLAGRLSERVLTQHLELVLGEPAQPRHGVVGGGRLERVLLRRERGARAVGAGRVEEALLARVSTPVRPLRAAHPQLVVRDDSWGKRHFVRVAAHWNISDG